MYRDDEDKDAPYMETFKEAAKQLKKGKMIFMYSDVIEGVDCRICEVMGAREEDLPSLRIIISGDDTQKLKYEYPYNFDDFTLEDIAGFIGNVNDG